MTKNNRITVCFNCEIATNFKEKFPQLKKLKNSTIARKLIMDELGDFSKFETRYYNDKDIKEIFDL